MDTGVLKSELRKDPVVSTLSALAREKGIPLYLVGGTLRDLLLGVHRRDYDFALIKAASSFIQDIEKALDIRFFQVGKEEMDTVTFRVIRKDMSIDLTYLQGNSIEEDLEKRDFTVNALAYSMVEESLHGVQGALEDLREKVIRAVSDHSINRDPLRMLRAVRYACTLEGFAIDPALVKEIALKKDLIQAAPGERTKMELDQILLSPRPVVGMRLLSELGLLFSLIPELKGLETIRQNEHHHLNAFLHTLLTIEKIPWAAQWVAGRGRDISLTPEDRLALYYGALFHDLGKQDTYSKDEKGRVHFYHHESHSSGRALGRMDHLRFSNLLKSKVLRLIESHMRVLNLSKDTKETALKRLVNQIGEETPLLVHLTLADKEASRGVLSLQNDDVVESHCLRILELFAEKGILHPSPLITGHDVMALGYPPGPKVGKILSYIRNKQVEGEIETREEALRVLKEEFT